MNLSRAKNIYPCEHKLHHYQAVVCFEKTSLNLMRQWQYWWADWYYYCLNSLERKFVIRNWANLICVSLHQVSHSIQAQTTNKVFVTLEFVSVGLFLIFFLLQSRFLFLSMWGHWHASPLAVSLITSEDKIELKCEGKKFGHFTYAVTGWEC